MQGTKNVEMIGQNFKLNKLPLTTIEMICLTFVKAKLTGRSVKFSSSDM